MGLHRGRHDVELGQEACGERDPGLAENKRTEREREQRLATTEAAIGVEIVVVVSPAADDGDDREAPENQKCVHEDVIDTPGDPLACRNRKADEDEPGVIDRGVREHPLHIALDKTEDRTEQQSEDRHRPQKWLPVRAEHSECGEEDAQQRREATGLGECGHEPGRRRGGALVDVRCPHVERHGRNLEAEADEEQTEPREQDPVGGDDVGAQEGRDLREVGRPCCAVNQSDAVDEDGRGERAEDEVLHGGLARFTAPRVHPREDVERDRHDLEGDEDEDQVVGRGHEHCA